jgi:hypothetical protein
MQFVLKKEYVEHARLRALATAIVNKEKAGEAFDEYRKEAFPWVETQTKRDNAAHAKLLQDEVKRGVLGIRPLWEANQQAKVRSRMKTKVVAAEKPLLDKRPPGSTDPKMKNIYSKLGSVI